MSSWFIFSFHLCLESVFVLLNFVFSVLFFSFIIFVEVICFFKLCSIFSKNWMILQFRKLYSLFWVNYEYFFEKVFNFSRQIFQQLFLSNCGLNTKVRMTASTIDLCLHIMSFKWIFSKNHEVIEDTHCPDINRDSIIRIAENLWSHIFFCTTMSFCSWTANWSCKTKISNFISNIEWIFVFVDFF